MFTFPIQEAMESWYLCCPICCHSDCYFEARYMLMHAHTRCSVQCTHCHHWIGAEISDEALAHTLNGDFVVSWVMRYLDQEWRFHRNHWRT